MGFKSKSTKKNKLSKVGRSEILRICRGSHENSTRGSCVGKKKSKKKGRCNNRPTLDVVNRVLVEDKCLECCQLASQCDCVNSRMTSHWRCSESGFCILIPTPGLICDGCL